MTLSNSTVKVQYDGDGSKASFAVPFVFWDDDDLTLILTDASAVETTWVRGTHYNVSGGSGSTGAIAVITSPTDHTPAVGTRLTIKSGLDEIQALALPPGGSLPSAAIVQQFDKTVRLIQQRVEQLERAILLTEGSEVTGVTVPDPAAGKTLRWNSAATALENATASDGSSLTLPLPLADGGTAGVTATAARTNLGLFDYVTSLARFYHGGI